MIASEKVSRNEGLWAIDSVFTGSVCVYVYDKVHNNGEKYTLQRRMQIRIRSKSNMFI